MSNWTALRAPVEAVIRSLRPLVLQAYAAAPVPPQIKADGSAVTALDLALEAEVAEALLSIDPGFGLFSEEAGVIREGSPTWHLDPLDGTANFVRRRGIFATQVALVDGATPLFSLIYEPLADTLCWAAAGGGAWREDTRLQMADPVPRQAHVYVDLSRTGIYQDDPTLLNRVRTGCNRVRALGSAAIHLRDIALGIADGYLGGRARVSPLHDLAPGILLIREAGGRATDGRGGDPLVGRRVLALGSPRVHDWLCGELNA